MRRRQTADTATAAHRVVIVDENVKKVTLVDVVVDVGHLGQQPQVDRLDLVESATRVVIAVVVEVVGRLRRRRRRHGVTVGDSGNRRRQLTDVDPAGRLSTLEDSRRRRYDLAREKVLVGDRELAVRNPPPGVKIDAIKTSGYGSSELL